VAWLVVADPGLAQTLGQAPQPDFSWVRWVAALLLCLLLAAGGAFALRARMGVGGRPLGFQGPLSAWLKGSAATPRRVQVIESVRASPSLELCLFTCDGEDFLVAATPHGVVQLRPAAARGGDAA
jgi:hypothetical protein